MANLSGAFDFFLPTHIHYGPGILSRLTDELGRQGVGRPLLVTDPGIVKAGIAERVTRLLDAAQISYAVFDGVEQNPKDRNVEAGAAAARAHRADSLIAVGGGSPIDCAKAIGVLMAHGGDRIKPYEGKTAATEPIPPLIAIPTTAGTGSELTFSAVITDTENEYKMTVKSRYTAPRAALCDPELTLSVPPAITAATGMDALTHAIEGFTAACAEPLGDAAALYSIELISKCLERAYRDGHDLEARSGMLLGSLLGGIAFSQADVASVHCIAEALGSIYDLPHGTCNAIFLPYVMEYNMPYCLERYARVARAMGFNFASAEEGAELAVAEAKRLAQALALPAFATLDVRREDYPRLARMAVNNGSNQSNPRPMNQEDYLNILETASRR